MRLPVVAICAVTAPLVVAGALVDGPASDRGAPVSTPVLVGQVLLPPGDGSRGVEIVATVVDGDGERRDVWVLFDDSGRFEHVVPGRLLGVAVSTGIRPVLHRIGADDVPGADRAGRIDVGVIDLRDRVTRHRVLLRVAEAAARGEVRVAMCFGLPPVGPRGERIALGSRQFPPVRLGRDVEWLVPLDARSVYFLVERPDDGGTWLGGSQQLFGPFTTDTLPAALAIE